MVALLYDHVIEIWYFVRAILQIGIHSNYYVTLGFFKPGVQCGRFTVIPIKGNCFYFNCFNLLIPVVIPLHWREELQLKYRSFTFYISVAGSLFLVKAVMIKESINPKSNAPNITAISMNSGEDEKELYSSACSI